MRQLLKKEGENRNDIKEDETVLNNWFKSLLEQRLIDFSWSVVEESPQQISENSNDQAGYPDVIVKNNNRELTTIEFLWYGNDKKGHAKKIHNYSDTNTFYLVVYCENENQLNVENYFKSLGDIGAGFQNHEEVVGIEYQEKVLRIRKANHIINGIKVSVFHILFLADFAVWKKNIKK